MNNESQTAGKQSLEIYTLGKFLVKSGDIVITEYANRSYKLWEVFKFLLAYREKGFLPEILIEKLWPEQDYESPKRALRALVYRLRHLLGDESPIVLNQGCYTWNKKLNYWLDTEEFEKLTQKARFIADENPVEAIILYERALSLYKGDYLPESSYCEWVELLRNNYSRLYLQSALELISLLQKKQCYSKLIKVCESIFLIEPFEEEFHLHFLDALLQEGKNKQAHDHYEYVTSLFYREMGIKPSARLRSIYRMIQQDKKRVELDLGSIQQELKELQKTKGAFLCDPDLFRHLYNLEKNRAERNGQNVILALLTLTRPDYGPPQQKELQQAMGRLQTLLVENLRRGDVITCQNDVQFLLLLLGINPGQVELILQRIINHFQKQCTKNLLLQAKIQPLVLRDNPEMLVENVNY